MPVRPFRFPDAVSLLLFAGGLREHEVVSPPWRNGLPGLSSPGRGDLLRVVLNRWFTGRKLWVSSRRGLTRGLGVARPRSGGLTWEVELVLALKPASELSALIEGLVGCAGRQNARRVLLELSPSSPVAPLLEGSGFQRYSGSFLYCLDPSHRREPADVLPGRMRQSADLQRLFQLYSQTVPASVRAAEALTMEEWVGLSPDRHWSRRDTSEIVWDTGTHLVGWARLRRGRSALLEMCVDERHAHPVDDLLHYALMQVSPAATVYAIAREYQVALRSALERNGFACIGERDLLAKHLAARVWEPRFVRAQMAVA